MIRLLDRLRDDDGAASAIQVTLCFPLVMLVIVSIIQVGTWCFAVNTAQTATDHAAWAARAADGTPDGGQEAAEQVLHQLGNRSLRDPHITVDRTATQVVVTVTALGPHFVPFWPEQIRAVATAPVEVETHA
ncbi:TadE family protein [Catenulispora pinisilvae]|uniref:TadE family protein n=1 Tax=Catenulispora pinisilvae TaxID=2705253 RepID=UPI001891303D|nr:TadE family protein [Catenulispora pinisilvae]